jgi:DNA-binding LacI/PurR family transcriptional regulator
MSSIKDVARLAGVSVSTVSRVLANSTSVDEETKRKVDKAIDAINYKPNLLAQGLRSKSGYVIGLAVPEILHETFSRFIRYTEQEVSALGYNLIIGNTKGMPDIEGAFIDTLLRRHVDGIIFSRVSDKSQVIKIFEKWNIPVVIIDRALDREDVPTVVLDNYRAGTIAAEHLVELGHRKFAVITGPQDIALSRERLKGFTDVLEGHGLFLVGRNICEGNFKFDSGLEAGKYLLENKIDFTALWAQNDLMALGAMNVFERNKLRLPEDISVVGMDNLSSAEMIVPTLTTVVQPFQEMCHKAVEIIMTLKRGEKPKEKRIVLQPGIIIRESTMAYYEHDTYVHHITN